MTVAAALLFALTACGEKPQRVVTEPDVQAHPDLRERTLRQGEAGRIAY
jgi:hypothetical protein